MFAVLSLVPLALAAISSSTAIPNGRTALTIYAGDLGFVRESRMLDLTGSADTVRLSDIPERIDFASVRLVPESGHIGRLAYRYDIATVDALLERAKGSRVRVTMRGDRAIEGTLAGSDGSWIVVRESDGTIRTLSRASVDDVSLATGAQAVFTKPMLEAVIDGAKRGRTPAQLSYLTGGISWAAEHILVRTGETTGAWSSAVTVENGTGRNFENVTLKLVAGEPRRTSPSPMPIMARMKTMEAMSPAADGLTEQAFSEYHLYSLGRPATVRDRETQQLAMVETRPVALKPRYLFRGSEGTAVRAQLELKNDAASGLGLPLPGGRVRMFEADASGELQFTGETTMGHTAEDEKLTLDVGNTFDLVGERREVSNTRISDREREYTVEIKLRNRKKTAVTIVAEENLSGDTNILQKSQEFTRKDANTIQFAVVVAPGKESVVTYTARVRY